MISLTHAVISGFVVGSVFVAAFAVQFYPPDDKVLLDDIRAPLDRGHTSQIVATIENNEELRAQYKNQYLVLFHISERHQGKNCPFGSCASIYIQTQTGFLIVDVDFVKNQVVGFAEQKIDVQHRYLVP